MFLIHKVIFKIFIMKFKTERVIWNANKKRTWKKRFGDAGYRSPYFSHAKRALYHLSYIPLWKTDAHFYVFIDKQWMFKIVSYWNLVLFAWKITVPFTNLMWTLQRGSSVYDVTQILKSFYLCNSFSSINYIVSAKDYDHLCRSRYSIWVNLGYFTLFIFKIVACTKNE